jgi:hypothetical protein
MARLDQNGRWRIFCLSGLLSLWWLPLLLARWIPAVWLYPVSFVAMSLLSVQLIYRDVDAGRQKRVVLSVVSVGCLAAMWWAEATVSGSLWVVAGIMMGISALVVVIRASLTSPAVSQQMKAWARALIIAAVLEVLMLTYLDRSMERGNENLIVQAVGAYHSPGALVCYLVLLYWNPGPRSGPTAASNAVCFLTMFGVQMLITTPIVYCVLRWVGRHRARRTQP